MHVGVKGSDGHAAVVAVSVEIVVGCCGGCCSVELEIVVIFELVSCCWENGDEVERISKMKRMRETRAIRASLRVHVNWVLDLMVS